MPYNIRKKGSGYKVCKKGSNKCFSKKPLSKEKANKQRAAIAINTHENLNQFDKLVYRIITESIQYHKN